MGVGASSPADGSDGEDGNHESPYRHDDDAKLPSPTARHNRRNSDNDDETTTTFASSSTKPPPSVRRAARAKRRAQAERLAFSREENETLSRLSIALESLAAEASGGKSWVEGDDLRPLEFEPSPTTPAGAGAGTGGGGGGSPSTTMPARRGSFDSATPHANSNNNAANTPPPGMVIQRLYRDEKAENTVMRAQNKKLLAEVGELRQQATEQAAGSWQQAAGRLGD
jgi:hypothetical protein